MKWKAVHLWIRASGDEDSKAEIAIPPQDDIGKGASHLLKVVFLRSKGEIYPRLLKLANEADSKDDTKQHFENERKVAMYLTKLAHVVNHKFKKTRTDVCIWPVETICFVYEGKLKWGMIHPPFLPDPETNKVFEKTDANREPPHVDDPVVGRPVFLRNLCVPSSTTMFSAF